MKIVFLLPQEATHPIGGFKVVYEYANGLAKRKHKVNVMHMASALPKGWTKGPRTRLNQLRYFPYAIRGNWKPDKWFELDPAVKLSWIPWLSKAFLPRADAYIATWWVTAEQLDTIHGLPGRKLYLIQHLETWSGPKEQVMATWRMPLEKIVIARWLRNIAAELGESCHYIPNGLDFTKFGCDVAPEARHPARLAMLFNNRLAWKGSADGLAAVCLLKNKYPDLEAEFYGVFPRPENLPAWIRYHEQPAQDELRRIYNRAAIFLAPSHSEGWGLPPSEAMTCGAAVVATDIGGHQEFCTDGQTALLVPAKHPEEMAEAASRLIDDLALRIQLAKNGYENIRTFTWSAAVDQFEKILMSRA